MKKIFILSTLILIVVNINAQTLIATSLHPKATANQNQRKIVRDFADNVYVVFEDIINQENVIKGVVFNRVTGQWSNATYLKNGKNPTLSICENGQIHLIYESNDSLANIKHTSTFDFQTWTTDLVISDTLFKNELPISDVDSYSKLNVFWIQKNDSINESLIYACISNDNLINRKVITTKNDIKNIAIANHLQYYQNDLFFSINFNQDSLELFKSTDNLLNYDTIFETIGTQPCITYNSYGSSDTALRFLYIDTCSQLNEVDFFQNFKSYYKKLQNNVDYVCIDNIAPPIGYSYLFMLNGNLYHGFSYGAWWYPNTILDTISSNPIYPSIAYKSYNFSFIDFIWMENNGNGFNIFHKRDAKHILVGLEDHELGKDFTITGFPNPFSKELTINVSVNDKKIFPMIQIFNSNSQLIRVLKENTISENEYLYKWNGANQNGAKVNTGVYIIMCSVGDKKTARKIIYNDK